MISLGARYIDYGLTGGFFLFVAMAVFGWYHPAAVLAMLENFQKNLPAGETKALETLLNGIFASLFVVCVFATGLLLDLVGSLLIFWELDVYRLPSLATGTASRSLFSLRNVWPGAYPSAWG